MMKKCLVVLLALIGISGAVARAEEGLKLNDKAPNFIARTLDDELFRLNKMEPGPKVISFFEVTCLPCKKELPEMAALEASHKGVHFLLVHVGNQPASEVKKFLAGLKAHPARAVYTGAKIMETYNFTAFPHTLLLDADNKVKLVLSGYTENNMNMLEAAIKKVE